MLQDRASSYVFTSEAVGAGHPDKLCDLIADTLLDAFLAQDPQTTASISVVCQGEQLILLGKVASQGDVSMEETARQVFESLNLTFPQNILNLCRIRRPSSAPSDKHNGTAFSDQSTVFGLASRDTICLMPAPIFYAQELMRRHHQVRQRGESLGVGADGKAQVTIQYEQGRPAYVDAVTLSLQHGPQTSLSRLSDWVHQEIILPVVPSALIAPQTKILVNPAGPFLEGGAQRSVGLSGRKISVDTYGGYGRHGGGAFSGKDGSHLDRAAAYGARQLAKFILSRENFLVCEVRVSYGMGHPFPINIGLSTDRGEFDLSHFQNLFPEDPFQLMSLQSLQDRFQLRRPVFRETASFGHFGSPHFPWEKDVGLERRL